MHVVKGSRKSGKWFDVRKQDGVIVDRISDEDVEKALARTRSRDERYFRLTQGQRKALGIKRGR